MTIVIELEKKIIGSKTLICIQVMSKTSSTLKKNPNLEAESNERNLVLPINSVVCTCKTGLLHLVSRTYDVNVTSIGYLGTI